MSRTGMLVALGAFALVSVGALGTTVSARVGAAATAGPGLDPRTLERAQAIRRELSARYAHGRGEKLVVTEASSTAVLESYTLLTSNLLETRIVPAENGVHYAVCPPRASCPYPARRLARPAAALLPRWLALELALRTFAETSASLVAVSLPTTRFTIVALERAEVEEDPVLRRLARELEDAPQQAAASWPREVIERATRPRVYAFVAMETTPSGRESFGAIPRWPDTGLDP